MNLMTIIPEAMSKNTQSRSIVQSVLLKKHAIKCGAETVAVQSRFDPCPVGRGTARAARDQPSCWSGNRIFKKARTTGASSCAG